MPRKPPKNEIVPVQVVEVAAAHDLPGKLATTTSKSLDVAEAILDMEIPTDDPAQHVKYLNVQARVVGTILNTQLRAEEQRLKRQAADLLPQLLRRVEDERKKRAAEGS